MRVEKKFFLIFLFMPWLAQSQISIVGKTVDSKTMNPLPFCHGIFKNSTLGVVSDHEGKFYLMLDQEITSRDSINFSCVGYKDLTISVMDLYEETTYIVQMIPEVEYLREVVLKSEKMMNKDDLKLWMSEVIEQYNNLDRSEPYVSHAFFREFVKVNGHGISYTEGLGYGIYMGDHLPWSSLALYKFYCDNVRRVSTEQWSELHKNESTMTIGADVSLNTFMHFKTFGLLSREEVLKYRFWFDTTYLEKDKYVSTIKFKKGKEEGSISINSQNQIEWIDFVAGKRIWSNPLKRRVSGNVFIMFAYYNNQPFVSEISVKYQIGQIDYTNKFKGLMQKLDEFEVKDEDIGALNTYNQHPYLEYDSISWSGFPIQLSITEINDLIGHKEIKGVSIESKFKENSGYWFSVDTRDIQNLEKAKKIINELRRFF